MWVLYLSFHVLNLVSCLSRYLHDPKFYKINIMFRSCLYTPTSMLLKFVQTQNYFTKFSKSKKKYCFSYFRLTGRPAPVPGRAHLCTSVGRPPRSTDWIHLLSGFLGRPVRSTAEESCALSFGTVDPTGRPEPTALCQLSWRSTGPVDRQACCCPTALSSFVQFWSLFYWLLFSRFFQGFPGLFQRK